LDFACLIIDRLNHASAWDVTSCGPSLREKVIDVLRRLSKSALSFQVHPGRGNPITLGIENRDPITAVALVVKYKFVSVKELGLLAREWRNSPATRSTSFVSESFGHFACSLRKPSRALRSANSESDIAISASQTI
jgi:hypothetical protein